MRKIAASVGLHLEGEDAENDDAAVVHDVWNAVKFLGVATMLAMMSPSRVARVVCVTEYGILLLDARTAVLREP